MWEKESVGLEHIIWLNACFIVLYTWLIRKHKQPNRIGLTDIKPCQWMTDQHLIQSFSNTPFFCGVKTYKIKSTCAFHKDWKQGWKQNRHWASQSLATPPPTPPPNGITICTQVYGEPPFWVLISSQASPNTHIVPSHTLTLKSPATPLTEKKFPPLSTYLSGCTEIA